MTDEPVPVTMPPANIQAEEALLGSMLISPGLSKSVTITAADFYINRHRWIFEAIKSIEQSGSAVDYMTICSELEKREKLGPVGGAAYLMGLINKTPSSMHADTYAEMIKDRAQRRRMIEIASELAQAAYSLTADVDKSISQIATSLANSARPKGGAQHASVFASRHFDRIDQLSTGDRIVQRIPTGFVDFDKCLNGGLRIPEMLILAGKPGLGKTKFIFQLGFNLGQNFPGAIYEMETDEDQILDREISRRTKISDTRLENGRLEDSEWPLYTHAIEVLSDREKTKVYLDFGSGWTTAALRADLARLKAECGITWFMVDYLKFLRDSYGKDETERLNHISGQLKQICRELNLAAVVIHSMNKKGIESSAPDLTDQSGGADIAFDADKILFMMPHMPRDGEMARENYRTFIFRKSRSRLDDTLFHLQAVKEFPAFLDVATPGQTASEPPPRKKYEKKKAADLEPNWNPHEVSDEL